MTLYTTESFSISLIDNIIYVKFFKSDFDFETIDEGVRKRIELVGENSYPIFADIRTLKIITRDARERLAAPDAALGVTGVALLVNSKVQVILFNFFHAIYKSPTPSKLFKSEKKALEWLAKYPAKIAL
jgi:hypothetical protein